MKKILSLILALTMCLSLCACGSGEQNNTTEGQNNPPSVEVPKELQEQISGDWAVVNPYDGAPQYVNVFEGIMLAVDDMKYDMKYEGENRFSVWADENYLGDITLRIEPNGNIYMTADVANYGDSPSFKEDCYKLGYDYVGEDVPGTEESTNATESIPEHIGMLAYIYGEWLPMEGNDSYRPSYIRIERDGKCYSDRFGELEWVISSETQETVVISMRDNGTEKCGITISRIDGEITGWYYSPTSSAYAFYNTTHGEFVFPTIAERMAPYCGTWYNVDGNSVEKVVLNEDHTLIIDNQTYEVGFSFYENYAIGFCQNEPAMSIEIHFENESNMSLLITNASFGNGTFSRTMPVMPTTVEITMDNWQEYFELKEYHRFIKNGFGEIEEVETYFMLITKDGIVCDRDKCNVTVERVCTMEARPVTVDIENEAVIYGAATESKKGEPKVETMNHASHWLGGLYDHNYGLCLKTNYINDLKSDNVWVVTNVDILRVTGSLTFNSEQ